MRTCWPVVRALSRSTGQQFLVDPRVKGSLTLVSEGQVPARQAYDMLLAALRMEGFSVVDVGGVAQVVPEAVGLSLTIFVEVELVSETPKEIDFAKARVHIEGTPEPATLRAVLECLLG